MISLLNFIIVDLMQSNSDFKPEVISVAKKTLTSDQMRWVAFYLIKHDRSNEMFEVVDGLSPDTIRHVALYALFHGLIASPRHGHHALNALHDRIGNEVPTLVYEAFLLAAEGRYNSAARRLTMYLSRQEHGHAVANRFDKLFSDKPDQRGLDSSVLLSPGDSDVVVLL